MFVLWMLGCGEAPDANAPSEPLIPEMPSADDVLQRHLTGTRQCEVLQAPNYMFRWDAIVTNGSELAYGERVIQQGTQGTSFSRVHERVKPNWGFSAIGRTPDGRYWSASNAGVVKNIEGESVTRQMMQNLDPTPLCGFEQRWATRVNLGAEEHAGEECWHLRLTWKDGTDTEAWFSKQDGTLRELLTQSEGFEQRRGFDKYKEFGGIYWPEEEKMKTVHGTETLIAVNKLLALEVDNDRIQALTPEKFEALLEQKKAQGVLGGPDATEK